MNDSMSNLPPGVSDRQIEDAQGEDEIALPEDVEQWFELLAEMIPILMAYNNNADLRNADLREAEIAALEGLRAAFVRLTNAGKRIWPKDFGASNQEA